MTSRIIFGDQSASGGADYLRPTGTSGLSGIKMSGALLAVDGSVQITGYGCPGRAGDILNGDGLGKDAKLCCRSRQVTVQVLV